MSYQLPGKNSQTLLTRGLPHLRDGIEYQRKVATSVEMGFTTPAQMIVGRATGDFVWDLDENRYIDLQNGWATNPLGNCHPEIIEAVHQAHLNYRFSVGASAENTRCRKNSVTDAWGNATKVQF